MTYQTYEQHLERQEELNRLIQQAVEKEVQRLIDTATCFDCDNPLTVLRTEDGITIRECEKCHGVPAADIGKFIFDNLTTLNKIVTIGR